MDITTPVLRDLAARIGQLTVQLAVVTAERDMARQALAEVTKPKEEEAKQ